MDMTKNGVTISVEKDLLFDLALAHAIGGRPSELRQPSTVLAIPRLNDGEHYAGIIVGKDGASSHHLILLPGEAEDLNWEKAKEWATEQGGHLPTRREQAMLYANLPEQFKPEWYWSCVQLAADSGCAWMQGFGDGYQGSLPKSLVFRARAVRRLVI